MKATVLAEPELEFGTGTHIDPRHGLAIHGPADVENADTRSIRVGIVGLTENIDGLKRWMERCREEVPAKESKYRNLYMPFPGMDTGTGFRSEVTFNDRHLRTIRAADLRGLDGLKNSIAVPKAVDLYANELDVLHEEGRCDVILIARPDNLLDEAPYDFRALLKARSLLQAHPIQLVRRGTWDPTFKEPGREERLPKQDEATRAWNLFTALYYKSDGVPWRLPRSANDYTSCYVGISFYKTTDSATLQTSIAQIYNQRGDGVVVRGAQAALSDDKQPHLKEEDAYDLLVQALGQYRKEHGNLPARIVLHKSSDFTPGEVQGFNAAATEERLSLLELVWMPRSESLRLFRNSTYPPLRGTFITLDETRHVLYTTGSVPFYKTYYGPHVPKPIGFRTVATESSAQQLAEEILALSKMNWNQTQLDGKLPITLHTAGRVGQILKHVDPKHTPNGRYAYYM